MADIYFWRQFLILCTVIFSCGSVGFALAFPSVLNPAITSPNSTDIRTTADHASWITSAIGIGSLCGCFTITPIMQTLGRKACSITMNTFCLIGWIVFIFAENITALYAARILQGFILIGSYISAFIVSEYVHPCRRGYFIILFKAAALLGVVCCHATSVALTWRHISIVAGVMAFIAILLTFFWPESPSHLAFKGRFAECERSFKWLNGNSEESQKHLKALIDAQRERIARNDINNLVNLAKKFLENDFQKAFFISVLLLLCSESCGKHYYMAFVIQIMTGLVDNKTSALYFSVGADLLIVIAVSISSVVIRYVKRRTILLSTGALSVLLMFLISALAYLKSIYTFSTPVLWFTALIVILQSFIANIGVISVAFTIKGEIFPLKHKGVGIFATGLVFTIMFTTVMKIIPLMIEHTKLYGTYAIFGAVLAVCMIFLYKIVPETKDKTLQEIEDELNGVIRTDNAVMESEKLMH